MSAADTNLNMFTVMYNNDNGIIQSDTSAWKKSLSCAVSKAILVYYLWPVNLL